MAFDIDNFKAGSFIDEAKNFIIEEKRAKVRQEVISILKQLEVAKKEVKDYTQKQKNLEELLIRIGQDPLKYYDEKGDHHFNRRPSKYREDEI
jgi:hypothetical protein